MLTHTLVLATYGFTVGDGSPRVRAAVHQVQSLLGVSIPDCERDPQRKEPGVRRVCGNAFRSLDNPVLTGVTGLPADNDLEPFNRSGV